MPDIVTDCHRNIIITFKRALLLKLQMNATEYSPVQVLNKMKPTKT